MLEQCSVPVHTLLPFDQRENLVWLHSAAVVMYCLSQQQQHNSSALVFSALLFGKNIRGPPYLNKISKIMDKDPLTSYIYKVVCFISMSGGTGATS